MNIAEFAKIVHQNSVDHGFYDFTETDGVRRPVVNIDQKLMLSVGELSEALEEIRAGRQATDVYYSEGGKLEGFGVELADAVIRIFDLAQALEINIEDLMLRKHAYNATRPHRHGKNF